MPAQKRMYVRYNGPLSTTVLEGHGHFARGEVKPVDYLTACALKDERCAAEGWEVSDEPFDDASEDDAPVSRRSVANDYEDEK
jgi:hypothetical protein